MKPNQDLYPELDNKLVVREEKQHYLPSTEVREIAPEFKDEIDLRDLLDTIIRRKAVILICLLCCFSAVTLYTFTVTPQFKAKAVVRVSAQSDKLTQFEGIESTAVQTMEFQQTQVRLLQSEQLAIRVMDRMDLMNNPQFNSEAKTASGEAGTPGFFDTLMSFVRPGESEDTLNLLNEENQNLIAVDRSLLRFHELFQVSPIRNSELIEVSFTSTSPALAAEVTNTTTDEFINMHMDSKLKASRDASRFLAKQIEAAQIKLEKSEIELQEFARKIGIVSLDPKSNLVMKQLEELNEALAKARSNRILQEARYQQSLNGDFRNHFQMIDNELIQNLKNKHASLLAEYKQLSATFKPMYPKMVQLKAQMDDIDASINAEKRAIIDSIKNDYDTAVKTEEYLLQRTEEQKKRAMDLEEKATQYKIYERGVESNKSIYQSLLQRSKEIEATVGASVTNIEIIDAARPPLFPFKPRVPLNLALGFTLGLITGVGAAFLLEYFDNTIKNPDEMTDRFGIPVLGLIPFDKDAVDNRNLMALKFFNEPRSPVAEAFRTTMTSVRLSVADSPPKTILVTSILPGAGKSSLSSNSCLSYLAEDERCLLIDVDLRKPSLHNVFKGGIRGKGLSSVLSGMSKLSEVIGQTEYPGLDFISSGPLPPNPAELLSSKRMRQLLQLVSRNYDRVILDGPPYQGFAEILVLSNMVDGVILVSVEGNTPREGVKHFKRAVTNVGGRILGAIINKAGQRKGYSSYSGYKYYSYNYEYGKDSES
ncbi:polysaccharide biosynthesis tyrosine autokinase [Desulforhopalus sp. IMCC35007]|uniref:GumC family protein n=1 Tax=Desulforhopalus sp. IMCC35007 TaxID=2569543 RepID=UPI00145E3D0B|nr:polysaccharide biosynthesis tyrosine autokinase [Desulforhopalus sp. IMCC35007]